jgi:hypothetical protein
VIRRGIAGRSVPWMRPPTIAIVALVALLPITVGCSRGAPGRGGRPGRVVQVPLSQMTDVQKLMLFERVPLGSTLSEVRQVAPGLGTPRVEGLPARGLTDADVASKFSDITLAQNSIFAATHSIRPTLDLWFSPQIPETPCSMF